MRLGYAFALKTRSSSSLATTQPMSCCTEATAVMTTAVFPPPAPESEARPYDSRSTWGRFLVLADPDGRSVVLAKMSPAA